MRTLVQRACKLAAEEAKLHRKVMILFPCTDGFLPEVRRLGQVTQMNDVWLRYSTQACNLRSVPLDTLIQISPFHLSWNYHNARLALEKLRVSLCPKVVRIFHVIDTEIIKGPAIWSHESGWLEHTQNQTSYKSSTLAL